MTKSVTDEYLEDFREQDSRTDDQFIFARQDDLENGNGSRFEIPRDLVFSIEEAAIRDFDTYINAAEAKLLNTEQWALVKQDLHGLLDMEEENLMDDLTYYDEEGETEKILADINVRREILGMLPAEIRRDYPYAASWHMPDGRWGWAEPRHSLRPVGQPDPSPEDMQAFLETFTLRQGVKPRFVEGGLPNE